MRLRGNGNHPSPNNVGEHPPPSHLRSMTPITQLFADLVVHASRNNPRNRTNAVSVSILNHLLDYGCYVYIMFLDIENNFYTCTTVKQMIFFKSWFDLYLKIFYCYDVIQDKDSNIRVKRKTQIPIQTALWRKFLQMQLLWSQLPGNRGVGVGGVQWTPEGLYMEWGPQKQRSLPHPLPLPLPLAEVINSMQSIYRNLYK